VGGWETSGRFEKERVRRRDNISEEVSSPFVVFGSTWELVDKGHVSGVSASLIKESDRERGDIAVTVSDRSCSVWLRSMLEEEMQAVSLVLVSEESLV
jgi:hypothetical protein